MLDLNRAFEIGFTDLANMGLWQTIVAHLTDSDDEVVMHACWVCGTAVQVSPD